LNATTDTPTITRPGGDQDGADKGGAGHEFVYDVDGVTYRHNRPKITGSEIMATAGIPVSDGLIQLLADGTTVTINPDDEVHLVPGAQFKRRPRFKRG
jgi:hypothetical protein